MIKSGLSYFAPSLVPNPDLLDKLRSIPFHSPELPAVTVCGSDTISMLNKLSDSNSWIIYENYTRNVSCRECYEPYIRLIIEAINTEAKEYTKFDFCNISTIRDSSSFGGWCSNIEQYYDLYSWGLQMYEDDNLAFSTEEDYLKNIKHVKNALNRGNKVIHYFQWHDRYYWSNPDGAHHSAAIIRQAREQKRAFKIRAIVQFHSIDPLMIESLPGHLHVVVTGIKKENNRSFPSQTSDLLFMLHQLGVPLAYHHYPVGKSNSACIAIIDSSLLGATGKVIDEWIGEQVEQGIMLDFKELVTSDYLKNKS